MIGLQATLHFIDQAGQELTLSAEDFFKQAAKTNHILTGVTIPNQETYRISYQRVRKTMNVDIPLLSLLITTKITNKKFNNTIFAVNNCVDFAQRDYQLEEFLNTAEIDKKLPETALEHINKSIYDKRSHDYKQHMFRVSIKKALTEIINVS
ncbi:MAG: hypothetical protein KC733_02285, partial [Candidatus Omnitrophica bacterium]|nr:hypothetical protein [Candidatus Omnitrophota bacterium]